MNKKWEILAPDKILIKSICRQVKCSPITASILVNRNIVKSEHIHNFLNPSLSNIRSPFSIKDLDIATRRICDAITGNEKILIFGDFDVDGVTATVILLEFLRYCGADASYYIPHRTKEGYGFQEEHIEKIASPAGINLIITVDCGSDSISAVKAASCAGIDVIITDHHNIKERPEHAVAVINPKQNGCESGFNNLAGVGVAFYLLISLRKHLRDSGFWQNRPEPDLKNLCDLVALGTVADIVPLVDENRILTKIGIDIINLQDVPSDSPLSRPGIKALVYASKINQNFVDSGDISFKLAPRINAVGRIGHADTAVELLTTKNLQSAKDLSIALDNANTQRQKIEKTMYDKVLHHIEINPHLLESNSLVLAGKNWHEGVLGIVASRLVKKFYMPVVLISIKGSTGKGSARSIACFNIYKGFDKCSEHMESFGGHTMAAGLIIRPEKITIFKKKFEETVSEMTKSDDFIPTINIDREIKFDEISSNLIDALECLKPFGEGNPEPIFMAKNVKVLFSKIVGEKHRKMLLQQPWGKTGNKINAIYFNIDPDAPLNDSYERIAFALQWNHWKGNKTAQIIIKAS